MDHDEDQRQIVVAERLASLGAPVRLGIVRLLVRCGDAGMTVGDVQRRLSLPASTLAHHLSALVRAGLVRQERFGREVHCTVEFATLRDISVFLLEHCCAEVSDLTGDKLPLG